jgi:hypothetical protein
MRRSDSRDAHDCAVLDLLVRRDAPIFKGVMIQCAGAAHETSIERTEAEEILIFQ